MAVHRELAHTHTHTPAKATAMESEGKRKGGRHWFSKTNQGPHRVEGRCKQAPPQEPESVVITTAHTHTQTGGQRGAPARVLELHAMGNGRRAGEKRGAAEERTMAPLPLDPLPSADAGQEDNGGPMAGRKHTLKDEVNDACVTARPERQEEGPGERGRLKRPFLWWRVKPGGDTALADVL